MASTFQISLNGKKYNLVQPQALQGTQDKPFSIDEVPAHVNIDPKVQRRVIWEDFHALPMRGDVSGLDSAAGAIYPRQDRVGEPAWWFNGCDARIPGRVMVQRAVGTSNTTTASTPFLFADASVYSCIICREHVYTVTGFTNGIQQLALSKDFSAVAANPTYSGGASPALTDMVTFNGKVWVGLCLQSGGAPNPAMPQVFWGWDQTSPTTTWTQGPSSGGYPGFTTGDTGKGSYFVATRTQIWRAAGANMWSWDGLAVNWSTAYVIGDPSTPITAVDVYRDALIIFKQDGIYSMDRSGQVYPMFPGFKSLGTNPRPIGQWEGNYYFATDIGAIWQIKGADTAPVGFDKAEPYPMASGTFGIPNAATRGLPLSNFMYVGFNQNGNPGQCYFLALMLYKGKHVWAPFRYFTNGNASALGFLFGNTNPANPYMEFAVGNTIYYMDQPMLDPFLQSNLGFDTAVQTMYLPIEEGAIADESKILESVRMIVDKPTGGTISVAYATDSDIWNLTNFQDMGTPIGKHQYLQQWQLSNPAPSYKKLCLRIEVQMDTGQTVPPIIRTVSLHYKQRPQQRRVFKAHLVAENQTIGPGGRFDSRGTAKMLDDLNSLRGPQPIELIDLLGRSYQVFVDDVGEMMHVYRNTTVPSYVAVVSMVEQLPLEVPGPGV